MLSNTRADAANKTSIFGDILRTLAKLRFAVVALTAVLPLAPSYAQNAAYVTAGGSGEVCTVSSPCGLIANAILVLGNNGRVVCLDGNAPNDGGTNDNVEASGVALDIDCPLGALNHLAFFTPTSSSLTVRIRHLGFRGGSSSDVAFFQASGTLILEDCVFTEATGASLDIEPNGPLNLVIRNSRISNNASGMVLKPAASGSIKATLDHVVITGNSGGGIKSDSTNGVVNLDISDSEISNNPGNGINLVGSANQNMLNLSRTVIAKNGTAGLQVNGATAAALVDTTLFDTNTSGATSVVGGGHVLTYGNNHIVGSAGSGFTGTAPSQ
jgi:hypothetical protein